MGFAFSSNDHDSQNNNQNSGSSQYDVHRAPEGSEYDWLPRLYHTANAVVEGDLGNLLQNPHSPYNQYVVFNLENATIVDGALYKRDLSSEDSESNHEKYKMFSFGDVGYPDLGGSEDPDFSVLNDRRVETNFGDKYYYDLVGASVAQDDIGNETVRSVDDDAITLDNVRIQSGVSDRSYTEDGQLVEFTGPTSVSKRIVRLLSEGGGSDLIEENFEETHGWASDSVETAEDLLGRRVRVWVSRESFETDNGDVIDYQHFNVLDVETEKTLNVRNNAEPESFDEVMSSEDAGETTESDDNDADPEGWSDNMVEAMQWAAEDTDGSDDDILAVINEGVDSEYIEPSELNGNEEKVVAAVKSGNF